jgi:hypothetical protein
LVVRWAGRSAGAVGSLARHSQEPEGTWRRIPEEEEDEMASSLCEAAAKGKAPVSSQQQSEVGRAVQQARGALTGFIVQAEATSPNDSIPRIAAKATRRMFVLGCRLVMAYTLEKRWVVCAELLTFYRATALTTSSTGFSRNMRSLFGKLRQWADLGSPPPPKSSTTIQSSLESAQPEG